MAWTAELEARWRESAEEVIVGMKEWRLQSEPWVFLVGRDGRLKAKFEGSVSAGELVQAVRADLLR